MMQGITIVIPSYNQSEYLPDAIESCLSQTRKPYEIIVVDDGSTDGSLEIARKYPVTVVSQVNKGLPSARNAGIMSATSGYVLFLDSDDMLMPDAIEEITRRIVPDYPDVIAPSLKCFGLSGEEVILMENPQMEDFRSGNRIGSCVCVRRMALLNVGGYSPRMIHGYEDLHLTINLLSRRYEIETIAKPLWLYRVRENSMALTAKDHHKELLAQINHDFPEACIDF